MALPVTPVSYAAQQAADDHNQRPYLLPGLLLGQAVSLPDVFRHSCDQMSRSYWHMLQSHRP